MKRSIGKEIRQATENNNPSPAIDSDILEEEEESEITQRISVLSRFCHRMSFFKYVILLLIAPPILNYAALKRESEAFLPSGEKVDVGWGQKMFISCLGEGFPPVILDAPTGFSSDIWRETQKQISRFTKVCIYDRSGIGFSDLHFIDMTQNDPSSSRRYVAQPSTVKQMADDLHYLVTNAKPLFRPFIIVGAEIGSLTARYYAHLYEKDVVGVVLVDPLVENMFVEDKGAWGEYWYSLLLPSIQSLHLSAVLGLSRLALLVGWLSPPLSELNVPEAVSLRQKYLLCNPTHMDSVFNEHLYMNASFSQMRELLESKSFPQSVSVSVITSEYYEKYPKGLNEVWKKSQNNLIRSLHPGCSHKIVENSEHHALYSNPSAVVQEVQTVINKWRKGQKISFSFAN